VSSQRGSDAGAISTPVAILPWVLVVIHLCALNILVVLCFYRADRFKRKLPWLAFLAGSFVLWILYSLLIDWAYLGPGDNGDK
jgi:hypothetical protein